MVLTVITTQEDDHKPYPVRYGFLRGIHKCCKKGQKLIPDPMELRLGALNLSTTKLSV